MEPHPVFVRFGLSHLIVIGLTFALPFFLVLLTKTDRTLRTECAIRWGLVLLLVGNMAALVLIGLQSETKNWTEFLPMHLCDWLAFILIGALLWKKQSLYDLAYFWGLAGTVHGVITPDLAYGFPHPYFFTFHVGHSGVLVAVAFLTFGCGLRPYRRSLLRAFLGLQVYMASAAVANGLLDENFGYLCAKPENPSLLDHLGPWPWYLLSLQLFALGSFFVYYLPWALKDFFTASKPS
jgi:hypothetical integral membrane protein (TIGR02206 family)